MNIQSQRIAYQIWWLTRATAGDCTLADLARFTGASAETCRNICMHRGWGNRYRRRVAGHRRMTPLEAAQACEVYDLVEAFV